MRSGTSRRTVLKTAALASAAVITAPYVRGAYAAGKLTFGCWDHWVPGANKALDQTLQRMGREEQSRCPHRLHHLAGREGQADRRRRSASRHRPRHHVASRLEHPHPPGALEPLDDVINALIKKYGPISPVAEYLAKSKGVWLGVPTAIGSQVKPCCSRFDLYKEHAGIDLRDMFPADESKYDKAKTDKWTWDLYLESAQKLHKAGFPVGLPMGQTCDAVDWVGGLFNAYGAVFVDAKDNIKVNSDQTRQAHGNGPQDHGSQPARSLCLGRRRQQSLADLRQGLGHHEPAERLVGRQARQSEGGGAVLDACRAEGPEGPLRRAAAAVLRPVEVLQEQVRPARTSCCTSRRRNRSPSWSRPRSATTCPRSRPCTTSTPGRRSSRRSAPSTAIRRAATSRPRCSARRRVRKSAPRCTTRRSTP